MPWKPFFRPRAAPFQARRASVPGPFILFLLYHSGGFQKRSPAPSSAVHPFRGVSAHCLPPLFLFALLAAALFLASPSLAQEERKIEDKEITTAVNRNLRMDEGVAAHLVDVTTREGIVTLAGTVDNLLARDRATAVAESIKGVRAVVNRIEVTPVKRPDPEILADVRKALSLDPAADAFEIEPAAEAGVVTLAGTVDSMAERRLAASVAKGVKGVKAVENEIEIAFEQDRPDSEIKADIVRRLAIDPRVPAKAVFVDVARGKVSLFGAVKSAAAKSAAAMDAWVAGVRDVDMHDLEVKYWMRGEPGVRPLIVDKGDEEIAAAVRDALLYDPRVFSGEIRVQVEDGVATLAGKVEDLAARRAAVRDARNTVGVWRVVDEIKVRPTGDIEDRRLEERVEEALVWDPIVERFAVDVDVRNRKVYLGGRWTALSPGSTPKTWLPGSSGVAAVENGLRVAKTWQGRSDREIKADIEGELFWSPFVDSDRISVSVENGTAVLEGMVEDIGGLRAAVDNAFEGGARIVRTRLRVRDEPVDYPAEYHYETYAADPLVIPD